VKVHTYTDHAFLLVDRKGSIPIPSIAWVDETNFEEFLYFSLYRHCFVRIDWEKLLSDRFNIMISHDFMFNNLWVDAWHLLIRPRKNMSWNSLNNSM
jgi:hypothetical protein